MSIVTDIECLVLPLTADLEDVCLYKVRLIHAELSIKICQLSLHDNYSVLIYVQLHLKHWEQVTQ